MKYVFFVAVILMTSNVFASASASASASVSVSESTSTIVSSITFVDVEAYTSNELKTFGGVRVNKLKNGNVSFNYCVYERAYVGKLDSEYDEKGDCRAFIGSAEGYSEFVANQKLLDYQEEQDNEKITSRIISGVVVGLGLFRARGSTGLLLKKFDKLRASKTHPLSVGIILKDTAIFTSLLARSGFKKLPSTLAYGAVLGSLLTGKSWLLDDAGDVENQIEKLLENPNSGDSTLDNVFVFVEGFEANSMADKLSRSL